jgi:hypothetical protein
LPRCHSSPRTRQRSRTILAASFCAALALLRLVAHGNEVPRLTFALLVDSIRANFGVTQAIASYNGKEVEIQGFIIPAGPPDLSFFLLSRVSALGNYCCEVPVGQDETVYVFATNGLKILYDPLRIYKVRGVFEAGMRPDATYGPSLFRIRNARVEEAVGAKIFKVGDTPGR